MDLRPLTDDVLLARLDTLVSQERENTADIVEHLAEVDRREIVVDRGYSSLFEYCRSKLRYSEAAAFLRIRAARAAAEFPRVLSDLRSGAVHLDAIMRLVPHLNNDNSDSLLDQAAGKSKKEVMSMVAALGGGPAPERDVVRRLPAPERSPMIPAIISRTSAVKPTPATAPPTTAEPSTTAKPTASTPVEVILPPPRVRLAFTASDDFLAALERLRGLLRHKHPEGRLEDVLKDAICCLLQRIDPDSMSARPRKPAAKDPAKKRKRSRRIPKRIRIEVWRRDGGRCAYVAPDGERCQATQFLEYDHVVPYAVGGRSDTIDNIRLLCRPHNLRLAKRRFGPRRDAAL